MSALGEPELSRLLAVGRALVSELEVEAVLQQMLETARDLTSARYAALGILDEDKEELERFLTVGLDDDTRRSIGSLPRGHGVLGELIRNPQPLRLRDVTQHPRSYGFPPGHPPMTTFLGVPVTVRGEAYGNLYLTDKEGGADFTDSDEQLVVVLSEWAAVAIDNARLYETVVRRRAELERAVRGLEATAAIARAVGFETDLERVLELVAKRGRAVSRARSFLVLLQEGGRLRVDAAAGEVPHDVLGVELSVDGSLPGAVATSGSGEHVPDLSTRAAHGIDLIAPDARSAVIVPLGFRGRAPGALVALDSVHADGAFDADDEHLLSSFAASAAIAIATAQSVGAERLRHSLRASDAERGRWARELHDETLQELGALKVVLDSARRSDDPERVRASIELATDQIELSIRNLQALITELRPAALDQIGLAAALDALMKRMAATSGVEIEADIPGRLREGARLDADVEGALYRVIQESLTNAVKHGSPGKVVVTLTERGDAIDLTVVDDGSGFETGQPGDGFGLLGMHERVTLVGGTLTVESGPGKGTTVRAQVPVGDPDS